MFQRIVNQLMSWYGNIVNYWPLSTTELTNLKQMGYTEQEITAYNNQLQLITQMTN